MSAEGAFRDPGIPDGERTRYRGSIDGREAGTGTLTVEASEDAYVQRLESTVEGTARGVLEMRLARRRGAILAERYRLETFDCDRPVSVEEGWFRDVRVLHFGGGVEPYARDVMPLLACAVGLRGLDFSRGAQRTFPIWLSNSVFWEISLRVERAEPVTVPAGTFEAWRVRARPSFEAVHRQLDRVVGVFLPPFVLHFEREAPHRFLRFAFPTGPFPWNPRGLIEATEAD